MEGNAFFEKNFLFIFFILPSLSDASVFKGDAINASNYFALNLKGWVGVICLF